MTLNDAIIATQKLTGQVIDQAIMIRWLSELDGQVALEIYHAEAWTPYTADDLTSALLIPFPYDKVYIPHLEAMTYYSNGEYDRYENASAMSNANLGEFARFVQRTRDCAGRITIAQTDGVTTVSGSDVWRYVSAYGTALLHGYTGTEEEWLASLVGPQGEQGIQGEQGEPGEGFPSGGAAGTVFRKASATDYDTEWDGVDTEPTANSTHLITSGAVKTALDGKLNTSGYITAGKKSGTTLGTKATAEGDDNRSTGGYSHAEGYSTVASGDCAHAEGTVTAASGLYSHAEGRLTVSGGTGSHAEGDGSLATAAAAHAEGASTTAGGLYSHAEGSGTHAAGVCAHAEGRNAYASGDYSHASGYGTLSQNRSQHVFGEYNSADSSGSATERGTYVEIVGNGTTITGRSNARTLDWNGNEVLAGKLTVGAAPTADMDATPKKYVDDGLAAKQGTLTFDSTPTANSDNPVKSGGVYTALGGKLGKTGGTMSGDIAMGGNKVTGLGAPTSDTDGATKKYIDDLVIAAGAGDMVKSVYDNDGVVAEAGGIKDYVNTVASPEIGKGVNLVDNWYFVGGGSQGSSGQLPINQRMKTSYTGAGVYTIDRWKMVNSSVVELEDDCVRVTQNGAGTTKFRQGLEQKYSGTLTISVLVKNVSGTWTLETESTSEPLSSGPLTAGLNVITGEAEELRTVMFVGGTDESWIELIAVKLELGDHQTLARQVNGAWVLNDPPPKLELELVKAQRYFQIFRTQSLRPSNMWDARPPMRANPTATTLTVEGTTYYCATAE